MKNQLIILLLIFSTLLASNNPKDYVARIGNSYISVKEFQLNYEFGFPNLKIGSTKEERINSYLQFFIYEKLFAEESKENNLRDSSSFKYSYDKIKNDLLLQCFIENEIKEKIEISEEEIRDHINKSKTEFQLSIWPEQNLHDALFVKNEIDKYGIDATIKLIKNENPSSYISKQALETDYKEWWEIPSVIFEQIKNLSIGEISNPIKFNDIYYLVIVNDIRRTSITKNEYLDKSNTHKKQLFSEKLESTLINFTDSLLTPKNIRTKKENFKLFADEVYNWMKSGNRKSESLETFISKNNTENDLLESNLVKYNNGVINIAEILNVFRVDQINNDFLDENNKYRYLNEILAISIRDYFILEEAEKKQYEKSEWYKNELRKWNDKINCWAYQEHLKDSNSKSSIVQEIKKLQKKYSVKINNDLLSQIEINETEKSKNSYYQMYISGTNRLAEPIVDGSWSKIGIIK